MKNKIITFIIGLIAFSSSAYIFDIGGKSFVSKALYALGLAIILTFLTLNKKKLRT
ncbi:MAG: hypothetical protein HUK10_08650 [Bacteroides heparinolyticus]|nr:hypothetical protein [Bacteroides heparinolyticus]